MKNQLYDLIIIGAGPAGLCAGIYAEKFGLNAIVIGKTSGGVLAEYSEIHNFPTYPSISTKEFIGKLINQAELMSVKIMQDEVMNIEKEKNFIITTSSDRLETKKIIITTGKERKKLGIKGEKEFIGKGVSYCATCDAGFFKSKVVAVIGGGDSALTEALILTRYASKVYIIHRGSEFSKAQPVHIKKVKENEKIETIFNEEVEEIFGDKKVKGVKLKKNGKLELDGVFIHIGSAPVEEISKKLGIKIDEEGYIITGKRQETNVKGVYSAGDITNTALKQAVVACSEGAIAANSVYEELSGEE